MSETIPPWSVPVALTEIPDGGRHFDLTADDSLRAALAKFAGLRALPRLEASFDVARHGARGLHVTGRVEGIVGQNCVVSLEPMENKLEEAIDILFVPPREPSAEGEKAGAVGDAVDPDAPEPLIGDRIDLGKIATEFLLLGIDPYPRKPGAEFVPLPTDDATEHPFAALAALKKGQGGE